MPQSDLGQIFAAGPEGLRAQRTFTDRVPEQTSFDQAVAWYERELAALHRGEWSEQDMERPRSNVLSYHGVGGIGKSSLLKMLRARADGTADTPSHWEDTPPRNLNLVSVVYDMGHAGTPSLETLLLSIRAGITPSGLIPHTFDTLFVRYWQAKHPGENLGDFIRKESRLRKISATVGLPEQIESSIGELAGISTVGSSVTRATKLSIDAVRNNRKMSRALKECRLLEDLLAAELNLDSLSFYPHALAWDLAQQQRKSDLPAGLIVFLDTFEEIPPKLEEHVQRLVLLLPNVLFVIAGRNRIRWADEVSGASPRFTSSGRDANANATDEPTHHLVGFLSDSDARSYLRAALGPVGADSDLVGTIVRRSGGLPIHLDLAVDRVLNLSHGGTVDVSEVDVSFPELASRTLQDLTTAQRRVALAACMFDAFDVELVRVAAGLEQSGSVLSLLDRAVVDENRHMPLPYSIHGVLRQALMTATNLGDDSWSRADFTRAAERALSELKQRWEGGEVDRPFIFHQGLRIGRTFGVGSPWLVDAANSLIGVLGPKAGWSAERLEVTVAHDVETTWIDSLAEGQRVVESRQGRPRAEVAAELQRIIESAPDSGELNVLRYYLAEALRDVGDLDGSGELLDALVASGGHLSMRAFHAQAHLYRRNGKFKTGFALLNGRATRLATRDRLRGDLLWTQASFDAAAEAYRVGGVAASEEGIIDEVVLCKTSEAFANAFVRPNLANTQLDALDEELVFAPYLSFASLLRQLAVALIHSENSESQAKILVAAKRDAEAIGHTSIIAYAALVGTFGACVRHDATTAEASLEEQARYRNGDMFSYLVEIGRELVGTAQTDVPQADWTSGALDRWASAVDLRKKS